jgi:hypothetical protein
VIGALGNQAGRADLVCVARLRERTLRDLSAIDLEI